MRELRSSRGSFVLLNFWATTAPLCRDQLRLLHKHRSAFAEGQIEVLAVNVDNAGDIPKARSFAVQEGFFFPVLFATEEVAGIYNIIYRYFLTAAETSRFRPASCWTKME